VILCLACVFVRGGLPSIEMWFDYGEDQWCDLSKVGMVEMIEFHQVMWNVMLESAKDQILGVAPQDNMCHHVSDMERIAD
jgi:hypothetical protein